MFAEAVNLEVSQFLGTMLQIVAQFLSIVCPA